MFSYIVECWCCDGILSCEATADLGQIRRQGVTPIGIFSWVEVHLRDGRVVLA